MNKHERLTLQADFDKTQKEIRVMQNELRRNPTLLENPSFIEKRTRLFYKSYCIDCTLRSEWAVRYEVYANGE